MFVEENGTIVGNWKEELAAHNGGFEVSGKGITLSFRQLKPEFCGVHAGTPKGHAHSECEQLTMMLEGGVGAVAVMDGKRYPIRRGSHWLAPVGIDHGLDLRECPDGGVILQLFPGPKRPPEPGR